MEISLRPATLDDALRLFEWRNDPVTRKQSINMDRVEWSKHIEWLNNSITNPHRKLLIAENSYGPVGTIRVDYFNDSAELSWTVSPSYRRTGYGTAILREALKMELDKNVYAVIKMTNGPSISMVSECGFVFDKQQGELGIWKKDKNFGH